LFETLSLIKIIEMDKNKTSEEQENNRPQKRYDLSEEASRRESPEATNIARQEENDDENESNGAGRINSSDDDWAENKVSTSLDEE